MNKERTARDHIYINNMRTGAEVDDRRVLWPVERRRGFTILGGHVVVVYYVVWSSHRSKT